MSNEKTGRKPLTDQSIIEALETLAAAFPWDRCDIWISREPEGHVTFTATCPLIKNCAENQYLATARILPKRSVTPSKPRHPPGVIRRSCASRRSARWKINSNNSKA